MTMPAYKALIGSGSEYMNSDPIVCAGNNSSIPHGDFRNRSITDGDLVLLEMSGCVRGIPLRRCDRKHWTADNVVTSMQIVPRSLGGDHRADAAWVLFSDTASTGKAALDILEPR